MNRRNKTIVWLIIFIVLITVFCSVATYAYFNYRTVIHGDFDVEVSSKGVDVLTFEGGDDASLIATSHNFDPMFGRNLKASTDMEIILDTTNSSAKYCYEVYIDLPDEKIFTYTQKNRAELLLSVDKKVGNGNYVSIIKDLDITETTGIIEVPTSKAFKNYINDISTTKRKRAQHNWRASVTLVWFEDIDQEINNNKTYSLSLETKRVDCK